MAFLTYHSAAHYAVKLIVFPALIAAIIFGYTIFTDRLGAPINAYPEGDFQYVHHQSGEGGDLIYLWAYTVDRGQRLYAFDYTRDTMEDLEGAKGRAENGTEYGKFNATQEDGFEYESVQEPQSTEGFEK